MTWILTATGISSPADLDLDDAVVPTGRRRTKKMKAQMEAAAAALDPLLAELGKSNVNLSGFASGKDDDQRDQIHVIVAKTDD